MMIKIFIYGCSCGANGVNVRRIKAFCRKTDTILELVNTKYDKDLIFDHIAYLELANITTSGYPPIVVTDGIYVAKLAQWQP